MPRGGALGRGLGHADEVRISAAAPALLGESPFWHAAEQALYYCDIPGRTLHRFEPCGGQRAQWTFETDVASAAPLHDGTLLLAMRDGLWRFDPRIQDPSGQRTRLAAPPYDPAHERFNDGKCDPQGRFWVGTIYEPREPPLASLHCFADGALRRMADAITVSNGLAWSPDGATMYWSDTTAHTVYAFDVDPARGTISDRRVFARFPLKVAGAPLDAYGGRPDGAAVDVEGCYWVAMFEGQRLLRLSPQGEVIRTVRLPVRCPTMPCFGGATLQTLFITTARAGRPAAELAEQPHAGGVLTLDVDVAGLPVNFCAAARPTDATMG